MLRVCWLLAALAPVVFALPGNAAADQLASVDPLLHPWPNGHIISRIDGEAVRFPSASPFALNDVESLDPDNPAHEAQGRLFIPPHASPLTPVPGVVLLHGARGVTAAREITYGKQFAAMGVAALVVDAFGSRVENGTSFTKRVIEITESMVLADAFAAQRALAARPEVDASRISMIGFSYGGMASLFAAHQQVADLYSDSLSRFPGPKVRPFRSHVAFYAPCIARFEDKRSTGAPILMMWGDQDELIIEDNCRDLATDLREGGSEVAVHIFEGAYHQWDGNLSPPWRMPRGLAGCSFTVDRDGDVHGQLTGTPFKQAMTNWLNRFVILALCTDTTGFVIGKNYDVRTRSNQLVGRFLAETLR